MAGTPCSAANGHPRGGANFVDPWGLAVIMMTGYRSLCERQGGNMAGTGSGRICTKCQRTLSSADEWITLDGGEIWCAECWRRQFGGETQAPSEEGPSVEEIRLEDLEGLAPASQASAGEGLKNLRPCMNCGQLCSPDAAVCPTCGSEPFPAPTWQPSQGTATAREWEDRAGAEAGSRVVHQVNIGQPLPQAQQPQMAKKNSGLAVASLVLGIIGVVLLPLLAPQVLALIFGAVARQDIVRKPNLAGKGMATAGLVLGIIGTALWFVWIVVLAEEDRMF